MTVLVTGGLGYVGSHAVRELVSRGERVINLDDLSCGHREAGGGSSVVVGDIGDRELARRVIRENGVDSVMHFAAFTSVPESVANPRAYYDNNVSKTLALLDIMIEEGVKMMIFSSSAAVFGEPESVPISEDHPKNPTNPYGRSKLMIEEILGEYERAYGVRSVSLRYFNAAGADPSGEIGEDHDPEHHLIPLVLSVVLGQRDKVSIFGTDWPTPDGTCVRDYIHVNDLAGAHLRALDALRDGLATRVYNLGNGSGFSVKEVVGAAERVTGASIKTEEAGRRPGDPAVLVASSDKLRNELGWEPRFPDLKSIIETAWNWHKSHPEGY